MDRKTLGVDIGEEVNTLCFDGHRFLVATIDLSRTNCKIHVTIIPSSLTPKAWVQFKRLNKKLKPQTTATKYGYATAVRRSGGTEGWSPPLNRVRPNIFTDMHDSLPYI